MTMKQIHLEVEGNDRKTISIGSCTKFTFIKGSIYRGSNNRLQILTYDNSDVEFIDSSFQEGPLVHCSKLNFIKSMQNSKLNFKNCMFQHKDRELSFETSELELYGCTMMTNCTFIKDKEEEEGHNSYTIISLVFFCNYALYNCY